MLKLIVIFTLISGMPYCGYSQWEQKNISTSLQLTGVHFITDDIGFVSGGNKLFKTENGGNDWETIYTANDLVFYEDILAINNDIIIAVGLDFESNQSVIIKTENGGLNWAAISISNSAFLKSLFFVSPHLVYCSGGGGTILKSTDLGDHWQGLDSGTGLNLESIYFVNEMVGIAVGGNIVNAVILKTQDGGTTWNQKEFPTNNYLQSVYFSNQETGYVVGWNGEIMKTEDGGDSWISQNSVQMTGNLEVVFTDMNTGYIAGGSINESLIQKTENGGDLWEDISPDIAEGLICIQFPSFNVGYAVGNNGTVIKTESGGVLTSIKKFTFSDVFQVYPNPTPGILNIRSEENHLIERLIIYDVNGKVIRSLKPNQVDCKLDMTSLIPNAYYLEIQSGKAKSVRKIIKK